MENAEPDAPLPAALTGPDLPPEPVSLELLGRAQRGDQAALHDLLQRYQHRLRRIVRIQLGNSPLRRLHDSMDVVQDTFLAALPKIGELRPRSAAGLLHWLSILALNRIRDAHDHQHAARRDQRRSEPMDDTSGGAVAARAGGPGDPREAAELAEIRELLDAAVADLPEDQRRVVLMRDYCGESWDRIAGELHREGGAARQLHQRAWIRLRRALRPRLEGRRGPPTTPREDAR